MLAATIIVAVLALIDFSIFKHAWLFSKSDFLAVSVTVLVTLAFGVETGVASGIVISILLHLYHTSRPHIAEIGRIPGTEHFRNTQHFEVETAPQTVSLRIDESLIFSNANYLDNAVIEILRQRSDTLNIVLNFAAINTVDLTGMEMLERLNNRLLNRDVLLHLSEVKMPVKKLLEADGFIERLGGQLYLTHMQAHTALNTQQDTL
jgi:SulP family sulfate permease